jgi:hypothetical protein
MSHGSSQDITMTADESKARPDVGCTELLAALQAIADLDARDSDEGFNEWGEADCFHKAQKIANNILSAANAGIERPMKPQKEGLDK